MWDEKKDMLIFLPTGRGKSLCYQLPSAGQFGLTLVVSPLVALMQDQVKKLKAMEFPAEYISSLQDHETQNAILSRICSLSILYVTPERLSSLSFQKAVESTFLQAIVIDEAHCVSLWGKTFRPSYRKIRQFLKNFPQARRIALSATVTPPVEKDIVSQLVLRSPIKISESPLREDIFTHLHVSENSLQRLFTLIKQNENGIIYTQSRYDCERLGFLLQNITSVAIYHAGLSREERDSTLAAFLTRKISWVVATSAFGMGIDRSDIRTIIHFHPPPSLEDYLQQIGRASRDGKGGHAYLLVDPRFLLKRLHQKTFSFRFVLFAIMRGKWQLISRWITEEILWKTMVRWIGHGLSPRFLLDYFQSLYLRRQSGILFDFFVTILQGTDDRWLFMPWYGKKRHVPLKVFQRWLWQQIITGQLVGEFHKGKLWISRRKHA